MGNDVLIHRNTSFLSSADSNVGALLCGIRVPANILVLTRQSMAAISSNDVLKSS
jgi:hypothetical protein